MNRITNTVKHLLIINVIMFVGTLAIGEGMFYDLFALHFPKNQTFKPWQIVTHMFMHGGISHLFFNMFALWMFGTAVEQVLGNKKFIFIYLSAGLGAVTFQLGYYYYEYYSIYSMISDLNMNPEMLSHILSIDAKSGDFIRGEILSEKMIPILEKYNYNMNLIDENSFKAIFDLNIIARSSMVGASGCIMGIMVAFAMMNPNAELMMIFLPIPIKAKYFIPGIIGLDIISAVTGQSFFSPSNTAYMAHIGGALTGFIIMWYWKKTQFNKHRWY